jgi:hypothetical protein
MQCNVVQSSYLYVAECRCLGFASVAVAVVAMMLLLLSICCQIVRQHIRRHRQSSMMF